MTHNGNRETATMGTVNAPQSAQAQQSSQHAPAPRYDTHPG